MQENMESLDCPDCQLQLLQQQTQNSTSGIAEHHEATENNHEVLQANRNQIENLTNKMTSAPFSHDAMPYHCNIGSMNTNSVSSALNISTYSYTSDTGGAFQVPSMNNGTNNASLSMGNSSVGISIPPLAITSQNCESTNMNATPIEPCDYNGYCSTCAILELPTNEKYYRPSNSRPHVFPPLFYTQGPSSVIPCFSPIPECGPWGNEYNPYNYPTPYSQSSQSGPTASASSEYYGTSNVVCNSGISTTTSSFESCSVNVGPSPNVPVTFTDPSSYGNTDSRIRNDFPVGHVPCDSKKAEESHQRQRESCSENDTVVSIEISSSSCSSEEEDNDSSCESESGDSINSEDRELISVVEDDEDEINSTIKADISQLCESGRISSANSKCYICQNPAGIADCTSPQLAKILENIDEDITAEDLDISVSSGDIEIGGIEDEMKDFNNHQKKVFNANIANQEMISFSRLAVILRIPCENLTDIDENKTGHRGTDLVTLCFRCAKLVSLADSLERQLSSTVTLLKDHLSLNTSVQSNTTKKISESSDFKNNACGTSSYPNNPISYRLDCKNESTQTEVPINEENMFSIARDNVQECGTVNTQESLLNEHSNNEVENWNDIREKEDEIAMIETNVTLNVTHESEEDYNPSGSEHDLNDSFTLAVTSIEEDISISKPESEGGKCTPVPDYVDQINSVVDLEAPVIQDIISNVHGDLSSKPLSEIEIFCEEQSKYSEEASAGVDSVCILSTQKDEECISTKEINSSEESQVSSPKLPKKVQKIVKNPSCNFCQRVFSTKSNLRAHEEICKFKISHEQEDDLVLDKSNMRCEKCGLGFRSAIRRRKHFEQGCNSVTFECEFCSKRFSKGSELKAHIKLHLGEKPFKCDECNASFSTKGNQVAHSRTHSTSKKFPCAHCEKGFNRRYALMMHLNRHNGVKPFPCTICSKSFSDPSNLNNHKKRSHRESILNDE